LNISISEEPVRERKLVSASKNLGDKYLTKGSANLGDKYLTKGSAAP